MYASIGIIINIIVLCGMTDFILSNTIRYNMWNINCKKVNITSVLTIFI